MRCHREAIYSQRPAQFNNGISLHDAVNSKEPGLSRVVPDFKGGLPNVPGKLTITRVGMCHNPGRTGTYPGYLVIKTRVFDGIP